MFDALRGGGLHRDHIHSQTDNLLNLIIDLFFVELVDKHDGHWYFGDQLQ